MEDVVGNVTFFILQANNLLLNGMLGKHPNNGDILCLADAVSAVNGLFLDRGVPPGIQKDDIICRCQIKSKTAGFQTYKKHLAFTVLEALH